MSKGEALSQVRLDKWLWATRFFRTRSQAQQAINGGKVHYAGHRVKASHAVKIGAQIRVQLGVYEKIIDVIGLSERRGNASQAALLYQETDDSIKCREALAKQRQLLHQSNPQPAIKPNKKQRRQIIRFIRNDD